MSSSTSVSHVLTESGDAAGVDLAQLGERNNTEDEPVEDERCRVPKTVTRKLYLSHLLSTWNSRSFEFGAVLFLSAIFPGTLLWLSIYALIRSASAIVLAPAIGRMIDTRDRLKMVRLSISECWKR